MALDLNHGEQGLLGNLVKTTEPCGQRRHVLARHALPVQPIKLLLELRSSPKVGHNHLSRIMKIVEK